jgi:hypothetical protein
MDSCLKRASDRTHLLFKGRFKYLCHSDPNLMSEPTLKSLSPTATTFNSKNDKIYHVNTRTKRSTLSYGEFETNLQPTFSPQIPLMLEHSLYLSSDVPTPMSGQCTIFFSFFALLINFLGLYLNVS